MKLFSRLLVWIALASLTLPAKDPKPLNAELAAVRRQAEAWRAEHRLIDLHQHIDCTPEHLARAVRIMDAVGLGKIYFDNARKLLARSLPVPVMTAARLAKDFKPDGNLARAAWKKAAPVYLEYQSPDAQARPEVSTSVRALWSDRFLYLGYEAPFTALTFFEPAKPKEERFGLWEKDVVEAFINADPENIRHYSEYEVAPNREKLDLMLNPPDKDFKWSSGFECGVRIDHQAKVWTTEMRIPLRAFSPTSPVVGSRWRMNLYRCDKANKAYLAWHPTLQSSFHVPERFGVLEFGQ